MMNLTDSIWNKFYKGQRHAENEAETKAESFAEQYELAKRIGDRRFGSACKHEHIKNGRCQDCLRKVVE